MNFSIFMPILFVCLIYQIHGEDIKEENKVEVQDNEINNRDVPEKILTIDTNMSQKLQQDARQLLITVYDQHVPQNQCEQWARGFYERYRTYKWVCFKYVPNTDGGDYFIGGDTYFIELAVTDPIDQTITNYLLFSVKRFL